MSDDRIAFSYVALLERVTGEKTTALSVVFEGRVSNRPALIEVMTKTRKVSVSDILSHNALQCVVCASQRTSGFLQKLEEGSEQALFLQRVILMHSLKVAKAPMEGGFRLILKDYPSAFSAACGVCHERYMVLAFKLSFKNKVSLCGKLDELRERHIRQQNKALLVMPDLAVDSELDESSLPELELDPDPDFDLDSVLQEESESVSEE